jgi:hypothetical protein
MQKARACLLPIKSGDLLQLVHIEQSESMTRPSDEVVPPETLQDAVDVHGGQAERVGEFDLRQRQPDRVILGQPNRPLPHQLAYSLGSVHKVAPGANFSCPDLVYAIVSLTPVGVLNTTNTYRANL